MPLGDYEAEHPSTALLIIEVSDTTLRKDRAKAVVYASAGIGEYRIVNLGARTVELYSSRDGDRYAEARTLRAGDTLRPAAPVDLAIAVSEILPRTSASKLPEFARSRPHDSACIAQFRSSEITL